MGETSMPRFRGQVSTTDDSQTQGWQEDRAHEADLQAEKIGSVLSRIPGAEEAVKVLARQASDDAASV